VGSAALKVVCLADIDLAVGTSEDIHEEHEINSTGLLGSNKADVSRRRQALYD